MPPGVHVAARPRQKVTMQKRCELICVSLPGTITDREMTLTYNLHAVTPLKIGGAPRC